ncbi:MAG: hypothetical protein ACQESG_05215 [Nanobdellota archaeon]
MTASLDNILDPLGRTVDIRGSTPETDARQMASLTRCNHFTFLAKRIACLPAYRKACPEPFQLEEGVEFGCGAFGWGTTS